VPGIHCRCKVPFIRLRCEMPGTHRNLPPLKLMLMPPLVRMQNTSRFNATIAFLTLHNIVTKDEKEFKEAVTATLEIEPDSKDLVTIYAALFANKPDLRAKMRTAYTPKAAAETETKSAAETETKSAAETETKAAAETETKSDTEMETQLS
jgi:uncharacterized protein with von Willebrand factor type A (vWA) domain